MIQFNKSIGFRLLGISFIVLALPLLVDSFILLRQRYRHAIEEAQHLLAESARLKAVALLHMQPLDRPLLDVLTDYLQLNRAAASLPGKEEKELSQTLQELATVGGIDEVSLLSITPEKKFIVAASSHPDLVGKEYKKFFNLNTLYSPIRPEEGYGAYFSIHKQNFEPFFVLTHPIYAAAEKRFIGILVLSNNISGSIKQLLVPYSRQYVVDFALLLPSSVVFAASDTSLLSQYFIPFGEKERTQLLQDEPFLIGKLPHEPISIKTKPHSPYFVFTWKEQEQIGFIQKIPQAQYVLLAYASKKEIFQKPFSQFFNIYSLYGAILIGGGTLASLCTIRMARSMQSLSRVMQAIRGGDLHTRYHHDPLGFEVNDLGEMFNTTMDKVVSYQHRAEGERVKREIFASELRLGQQAQRRLLPQTMPSYPGVTVAELYIPAIEVGGDFYDVFIQDREGKSKLVLAIADASGKGVHACFYSLCVRNMLHTYVQTEKDIASALAATNNLFREDAGDTGMFVTVLGAIYDYQTRLLSYYSCGHNPGFVRRVDGSIETMQNVGMAMGILPVTQAVSHEMRLEKGDIVVFYTDGITEQHNKEYEFFGEERLFTCLRTLESKEPADIIRKIVESVQHFALSVPQHDDITVLVMKVDT